MGKMVLSEWSSALWSGGYRNYKLALLTMSAISGHISFHGACRSPTTWSMPGQHTL
jgi:hypothetical protein